MEPPVTAKIARLKDAEPVAFGPLAQYAKLTGDDGLPVFTGIQTCKPGYQTPLHWHPYVECLFVIEGVMEAWVEGEETPSRLHPGDLIALPARAPHWFRNPGDADLRLLGIHNSPTRIVNRIEEKA